MKYDISGGAFRKSGRFTEKDGVLYFAYSANYIEFETEAGEVTLTFVTDNDFSEVEHPSRAAVTVNNGRRWSEKEEAFEAALLSDILLEEPGETAKTVFLGAPGETKTVRVSKLSEAHYALFGLRFIEARGDYEIRPTKAPEKFIEFVGDSLTCGYGNEGREDSGEPFSTATENPLDAFAVLAAEKLGTDYRLVSWSGIGTLSCYTPPEESRPHRGILMQDLYPYNAPLNEARLSGTYKSGAGLITDDKTPYGFTEKPAAVVVTLGTNDESYTRSIKEREEDFAFVFGHFIDEIHKLNPGVPLLFCHGLCEDTLVPVFQRLTENYQLRHPECPIRFFRMPQQQKEGRGIDGHPNKKVHLQTAKCLAAELEKIIF